jgi:hypothetical protein
MKCAKGEGAGKDLASKGPSMRGNDTPIIVLC